MTPPPSRARPRDLGIRIGSLPAGPTDSIVDVADVRVGHATAWRDEPAPPEGRGVARSGVTAIVPFEAGTLFRQRVAAGAAVLNGAGEAIGITTIGEWGVLETPIFLTTSMAIGRVYDAAITTLVGLDPGIGDDDAVMPVVAECDDGWLNASRQVQVDGADVAAALADAAGPERGPVRGGSIGAGTGMVAFELKGGIGSASRVVRPDELRLEGRRHHPGADGADAIERDAPYTVGALALANFGWLRRLTVDGVRVGEVLHAEGWADGNERDHERGSCVVVIATDAPMSSATLTRLARRAGMGLARTGSTAGNGSGEIFIAFSTGARIARDSDGSLRSTTVIDDASLDPFFGAVVDASEAAVIDALFQADTVTGRDGHTAHGLPIERTLALLRAAGRLAG